jgi:predicted nucleic acid-binding Zn ribbon protein
VSRDPRPLADSLQSVVRSLRPDDTSVGAPAIGGVFGRWEDAVGAAVAAHVQPVKLDGTTLTVEVDDPAWATQLRFLETTLKRQLLVVAGATIDRIEARVTRH